MGASKELYIRIQRELNYNNLQYQVLKSYEEEERIKENKNYEKIQHSKLRKVQERSKK